jgi:hypothetical protein
VARGLLRSAMLALVQDFEQEGAGAHLPTITGGADEQDFADQPPEQLYMVAFTLSMMAPVVSYRVWPEIAADVTVDLESTLSGTTVNAQIIGA